MDGGRGVAVAQSPVGVGSNPEVAAGQALGGRGHRVETIQSRPAEFGAEIRRTRLLRKEGRKCFI